jgi:tellurite resistance protein TehA-like permease
MSIKTKLAAFAVAALAATGSIASTTSAEAHGIHPGWGLGLVGAAVVGSAIAATAPYPAYGYRCGWARQYDAFGRYIGRVNTCY